MSEIEACGDRYSPMVEERQKYIDLILGSVACKKIVAGGPGTGKTHLFKKVLDGKKNCLALTFVNALVEQLSLELFGLAAVKTLHGYALSELNRISKDKDIKLFHKLSTVIGEDSVLLRGANVDFDHLFHMVECNNDHIEFYRKRRKYYQYYGFCDVIYCLIRLYEKQKNAIPRYDQILIDEFQDFNKLEVSLIDLLAEKSPILIVGDDDQALYDFKDASTQFIRERYNKSIDSYESFNLPYCTRSTQVIVEAANDIIVKAIKEGFFKDRINKPYLYFADEKKDRESQRNKFIVWCQIQDRQTSWFIGKEISNIATELKSDFSVLIISPTRTKSLSIVTLLKKYGFENIDSRGKKEKEDVTLLDGLKILAEDINSNLGWRVVSKYFLKEADFVSALKSSLECGDVTFREILDKRIVKEVKKHLKAYVAVKTGKDMDVSDFELLIGKIGVNLHEVAKKSLKQEFLLTDVKSGEPGLRKIPIKATTIQGAKGLSADYVFITHFDDRYFLEEDKKLILNDQKICNFLVSLTRARKKAILISSVNGKVPTFLNWIDKSRIQDVS